MTDNKSIRVCLIANRGEIAVRVIRACRELDIRAIAVYSDADATARHVRLADHAVHIGASPPRDSYLNIQRLIDAALATGCDAVHPGYGFLSENAAFASAVIDAGLIWVGPPPSAIQAMGVKTEARALMERAGIPLVRGYQAEDASEDDWINAAAHIGYPLMVKAAGGGGGKGIRIVRDPRDLTEALAAVRREAQNAFGDARIFLERYIEHARHIEIQVLADAHGNIVHLFERECSAQRRHQKVIEESPSPYLTAHNRARMGETAVEAARAVGYINAGTVEFIATPDEQFYFLEMNTRLQVEHPVTEAVTGLDLVKLQFHIAAGGALPFTQADLTQRGHAIEARLYAEDPTADFAPSPGTLTTFNVPTMPGVRVDSGVESGDSISVYYDPMIAKIIVFDSTRAGAIRRLESALRDTVIVGATTNRDFLRALINHPTFAAGEVDTTFIERHLIELIPPENHQPLGAGAVPSADESETPDTQAQRLEGTGENSFVDPWARADGYRIGEGVRQESAAAAISSVSTSERRATRKTSGGLTATMPGQVQSVLVSAGDTVTRGQVLVILEAMKMEIKVAAPADGVVKRVWVSVGDVVERGQGLIEIGDTSA